MKARSQSHSASPRESFRIHAWKLDNLTGRSLTRYMTRNSMADLKVSGIRVQSSLTLPPASEAPKLALENVEPQMNMAQLNGLFKDHVSPERQRNGSIQSGSSPVTRKGLSLLNVGQARLFG